MTPPSRSRPPRFRIAPLLAALVLAGFGSSRSDAAAVAVVGEDGTVVVRCVGGPGSGKIALSGGVGEGSDLSVPILWTDKDPSTLRQEPMKGGGWKIDFFEDAAGPADKGDLQSVEVRGKGTGTVIAIVVADGPGEGFNDPSPRAPVGGNTGATLGQQRLDAFEFAASIWADRIVSAVEITVNASFDPLACTAMSTVLGAANTEQVFRNFTGETSPNTWHHSALANALSGSDIDPAEADLRARFNSDVDDNPTCTPGVGWYYGFDRQGGADLDLIAVLLHEFAHGLGFSTFVDGQNGARLSGFDDVYMRRLEDHSLGLNWHLMNDVQRAASAVDSGDLHWTGPAVVAESAFLTAGRHSSGHVEMWAPATFNGASSVSHFSTSLTPNEIMEPNFVGNIHEPGLAVPLLGDIGWTVTSPPVTVENWENY